MADSDRYWLKQIGRTGLRWLYFTHRWLGVAACLFFAMWFASGLVMMYVPFPSLSTAERLEHQPQLEWGKVRLTPDQALRAAAATRFPGELRLEMMGGEPVFRIAGEAGPTTISAVDGRRIERVEAATAAAAARMATGSAAYLRTLEQDQWTVAAGYDSARPLHLFDTGGGGRLYVSGADGRIVLDTGARERAWNWVGSVPHWLYPTVLRTHQPVWRQVVMWTSGIGVFSAMTGAWIGILRLRIRRKHPSQSISPYRGWMKWHHWAGLFGGLFLITWIVSGWLSVNPFRWFDRPSVSSADLSRYAGQTAARLPADLDLLSAAGPAKQVRFYWLQGRPIAAFETEVGVGLYDPRSGRPIQLSERDLISAARGLMHGAPTIKTELQTEADDYWYSHHEPRPLPVLKAAFGDRAASWIYIDPKTGDVLDISNRSSRAYRWWFNGLHQLDFRFLIHNRPAWDLTVWLLSVGGIITSISGVVIGWRRLLKSTQPKARHRARGEPSSPA